MVQSFKFAIVRLAPGGVRDERINIGLVVFSDDGVDVRLPRRLDKVRVLSAAISQEQIRELVSIIDDRDASLRSSGIESPEGRYRSLGRVGPLNFSSLGSFVASNAREYEVRIEAILESVVNPEPAPITARSKKSKVLSQLKRALRDERILAAKDEGLETHRVVPNWSLSDGLVADLVLKNGKMHVLETVDVSDPYATARKAVTEIAVSALVLEQARMNFGENQTSGRLIYEASVHVEAAARSCLDAASHQGAELYNWASNQDKLRLISSIASLAVPRETKAERLRNNTTRDHPRLRLA